jgi:hypothetical protein
MMNDSDCLADLETRILKARDRVMGCRVELRVLDAVFVSIE